MNHLHPIFQQALAPFALPPRRSSADHTEGWQILAAAMIHLTDRVMTAGDVQAWWLMSDVKEPMMTEVSQ